VKILFVVLLFCFGVFAQEEIGVPFVTKDISLVSGQKDTPYFYDASLSFDEKTLYTLNQSDGTISKWQLNPFKKIDTFKVTDRKIYSIWVSPDEKKLVMRVGKSSEDFKRLDVWDLEAGRFTGYIQDKYPVHIDAAIMNESGLVTISLIGVVQEWDLDNLIVTRSIDTLISNAYFFKLSQDRKTLIIATYENKLIFLNNETFKIEETKYINGSRLFLSPDYDVFYYLRTINGVEEAFKVDINTREITQMPKGFMSDNVSELKKVGSGFMRLYANTIYGGNRMMIRVKNNVKFHHRKNKKKIATLHTFDKGAWIVITPEGNFDASENARQYLMQKTESGEVKPIDETTYQKYKKAIDF